MRITAVERLTHRLNGVSVDGEPAFVLSDRELVRYGIAQDSDITPELYEKIISETEVPRVRIKVLNLLASMDRTEAELRRYLRKNHTSERIIDDTVQYLKSAHYLDDDRYTDSFIRSRIGSMSRREIWNRLAQKGIGKDSFDRIYEECCDDIIRPGESQSPERKAAVKALGKKIGTRTTLDPREKMKVFAYMFRKGFGRSDILAAFDCLGVSIGPEEVPETD